MSENSDTVSELKEKIATLQDNLDDLQTQHQKTQMELSALQDKNAQLRSEIEDIKSQLRRR